MKRKLFGILAALTVALGIGAATAGSAQARLIHVGSAVCNDNWVCLWDDQYWQPGTSGVSQANSGIADIDNAWVSNLNATEDNLMNDETSSLVNNTGWTWCFFSNANFSGANFAVGHDEWWGTVPGWINDSITSFKNC